MNGHTKNAAQLGKTAFHVSVPYTRQQNQCIAQRTSILRRCYMCQLDGLCSAKRQARFEERRRVYESYPLMQYKSCSTYGAADAQLHVLPPFLYAQM